MKTIIILVFLSLILFGATLDQNYNECKIRIVYGNGMTTPEEAIKREFKSLKYFLGYFVKKPPFLPLKYNSLFRV